MIKPTTYNLKPRSAGTLIELVIAVGIIALVVPAIIIMSVGSHSGTSRGEDSLEATALAQEGLEAVRAVRDYSWDDVTLGIHGITDENSYWELTGTPDEDIFNKYTRTIEINEISSYKKEVIVTVGWELEDGTDKEVIMTGRLTNWKILSWIETTEAEFNAGTLSDVSVVNLEGGELQIESLPDWENPDMLDSYATDTAYEGLDVFVSGDYAYMGSKRPNQGDDPGFYIFDVSTPGSITLAGYFNVNAAVNSVYVSGDYIYLATGLNNDELIILDASNKADPIQVGEYNSDESRDGLAVFVQGDVAYLGTENNFGKNDHEFYVLDVNDPSNVVKLDSYDVYNSVHDIYVSGNYAYAATSRLLDEMIIFDISSPSDIEYVSSYNEAGYFEGYGLTYYDDTVYFATSNGWLGSNDFHVLDVEAPASPVQLSALDLETNNNELCINGDYAYVGTDKDGEELTIIDISNPSSVSEYGYYDAGGDVNGVYCSGDYVYLATESEGHEFQVLGAGAGGGGDRFLNSGTFTSQTFDTGSDTTTYYTLAWTEEGTGTLKFQIKTADTEGNLSSANWVGTSGSGALYYTTSGESVTLDPGASGSRWVQYQATFEGDGANSPILKDLTLEYAQ